MTVSIVGTFQDGAIAIANGGLGAAVVVDPRNQRFKGLITDGDLRRALLNGAVSTTKLDEIVNQEALTIKQGTPAEKIASLFTEAIRVIPILNEVQNVVDIAVFDKRLHLPVAEPYLTGRELVYVTDCIVSGWISSSGKYVKKFESLVAESCNTKFGISTTSGTTALHLALVAAGIGRGDEVIMPTLTFIATASAVHHAGARPVLVDVDKTTMCIDPELISGAISSRTKAVIPVHLYGHPANMDKIKEIAERHRLWVIEDAAEAQGSLFNGSPAGSLGHMGVFSFYGNKTITTGEGGMIVTNNSDLADKMRLFRDHGMDPQQRYWHPVVGFNYRMTNLQAAVGVGQMEKYDAIVQRKKEIAETYRKHLKDSSNIILPIQESWAEHSYWLYTILIDKPGGAALRNEVINQLKRENIEARPTFIPLHRQPPFKENKIFPMSDYIADNGISLPSFFALKDSDIQRISSIVKTAATSV